MTPGASLRTSGQGPPPKTSRGGGALTGRSSVLSCRLKVSLPRALWLSAFTRSHPEARLEVRDRLELGRGLTLFDVSVHSENDEGGWSEEVRRLTGVKDVELVDASEGSESFRVFYRGKTFIPLLKELKLLRHFPFPVQNGVATWTVVGPEERVRALLKSLETEADGVHVDAVHHGPLPTATSNLTPHQQRILRRAIEEGYFDVPRRISLTELATKIGVATSTLSVTLAVIEKKIVEPAAGRRP